jgi:putative aldouronate transport system substrate-binding protein
LNAFKKDGVKSPFTDIWNFPYWSGDFAGAYQCNGPGGSQSIYLGSDSKLLYGPMQPGYKDYLTTMNKWYKEGLIDPDFVTLGDWGVLDTKMTSGQSAACVHFLSRITQFTTSGKATNPNFQMVAAPHPVLKKGDKPYLRQESGACGPNVCVNAKSSKLHEAIKYLDYGYTPEGRMLFNFGVEGESYKLDASGNPVYTEMITKDPNEKGWTKLQSMGMYVEAQNDGPSVQSLGYFQQTKLTNDAAKNAVNVWKNSLLSTYYAYSPLNDAETKSATKFTDLDTYVTEMTAKFITGSEPISNFDKYVERIKQLNVDEILAAYQSARDRFTKR